MHRASLINRPVTSTQFSISETWFEHKNTDLINLVQTYMQRCDLDILELGCFEGYSTITFATKLCTSHHNKLYTIDVNPSPNFFINLQKLPINIKEKISLIREYTSVALKKLNQQFDLIYIDASHFPDDVLEDAVLSFQLLKNNGLLIFDDYNYNGFDTMNYLNEYGNSSYINEYNKDKLNNLYNTISLKSDALFLHDTINAFASIYAPRLEKIEFIHDSTAIFKKIAPSFHHKYKGIYA